MNVNMNTSAALVQNASDAVGVAVLKKANDIQAQTAMALINAIPQPPQQSAANLPPHLGQNINTTA
ncbi:MAG: YjfB family protein [Gallionella sp.]|nr:YjfB family protein [Gallionella sp.]